MLFDLEDLLLFLFALLLFVLFKIEDLLLFLLASLVTVRHCEIGSFVISVESTGVRYLCLISKRSY